MKTLPALTLIAALIPLPVLAQSIPGLESARLLPGWTQADGTRMAALELRLQPGWKTYWRSPGDAGIPPAFDWTASDNLASAEPIWPRPEVIHSGGMRTLGYHDLLVLPIRMTPTNPDQPMTLAASVDFGLCQDICVPAHVDLRADASADQPDPLILAALDDTPAPLDQRPTCRITQIKDGMQVSATLPYDSGAAAAMELADSDVWVSEPDLTHQDGVMTLTADFVPPSAQPFALDPAAVRLTLITADAAHEVTGCADG